MIKRCPFVKFCRKKNVKMPALWGPPTSDGECTYPLVPSPPGCATACLQIFMGVPSLSSVVAVRGRLSSSYSQGLVPPLSYVEAVVAVCIHFFSGLHRLLQWWWGVQPRMGPGGYLLHYFLMSLCQAIVFSNWTNKLSLQILYWMLATTTDHGNNCSTFISLVQGGETKSLRFCTAITIFGNTLKCH